MASEELKKVLKESGLRFTATGEPESPEEPGGVPNLCLLGCYYTGCNLGYCTTGCDLGCYSVCNMGCDQGGACWIGCFYYADRTSSNA
jgi:hypothetical protein